MDGVKRFFRRWAIRLGFIKPAVDPNKITLEALRLLHTRMHFMRGIDERPSAFLLAKAGSSIRVVDRAPNA